MPGSDINPGANSFTRRSDPISPRKTKMISKLNNRYLIVGIGINLIKNPNITNYPTTNLNELLSKKVSKNKIEKKIKEIFETKITKLYK